MSAEYQGYFRYPTVHQDRVVFVAEDDLWEVPLAGGVARRLTANLGAVTQPLFSPDGEWIAFVGREEGQPEVYVMPASGGPARRLTYLGSDSMTVGWRGDRVVFASTAGQPLRGDFGLYTIDLEGYNPERLTWGPARSVSWGQTGVVIGRNTGDPARWKRYRGGTAGELWIDKEGTGEFHKLIELGGSLANPMWIGDRVYFVSDHEGIGNVHSCTPEGTDLLCHTDSRDFYTRNASTDGQRIVYHAGADLFVLNTTTGQSNRIDVAYHSPGVQRNRKFASPAKYLEDYALSDNGSHLALTSRGQLYTMGNWDGPVLQQGNRSGVRYRLACWLKGGKRVVLASDEGGLDHIEVHHVDGETPPQSYADLDVGRPQEVKVSPTADIVAIANHREELFLIDLEGGTVTLVERSAHGTLGGFDWSPDGRWLAYSFAPSQRVRVIKLYDTENREIHPVTEPLLQDYAPAFDPEGKYLYFLSARVFNPVYDNLQFDLSFPKGARPYAITLRKDLPSPFVQEPRGFDGKKEDEPPLNEDDEGEQDEETEETAADEEQTEDKEPEVAEVGIDLDGIADRIVAFPVAESLYTAIEAIKDRVFYTVYPVESTRGKPWFDTVPKAKATLMVFDLDTLEESVFVDRVTGFKLSGDGSAMACRIGNRLRVIKAKRDPSQGLPSNAKTNRKSGWVDLARLRVSIDPAAEWRQMYHEAWRLQRDYFWTEDMSGVDWERILRRYQPLVERVGCRSEFSDLMWEMQGELSTSHCYELGGDYRPKPEYSLGFLGADLDYDPDHQAYRFDHVLRGDVWDEATASPLRRPGVNVTDGMLLLAVGGQRVSRERPPNLMLVNTAGQEVQLTVAESDGSDPRTVSVKTLRSEVPVRYRDWVEDNRRYVHEKSGGEVGYVHVPDMGPDGYAEFHRYYLMELDHRGLIVDVRHNGGGHVSGLLLAKLARKRLGYDLTRWMGSSPYPEESVRGPMVALTDEQAGSDGDIFSHAFKLMKLGKLIGKRTWGGVVGIWPRNSLVDGSLTTQPEFSFWFKDVGWGVENYGTDPDIEVDVAPQDYARGVDPQLDRAIEEVMAGIEANPPFEPDFENKPRRTLPG